MIRTVRLPAVRCLTLVLLTGWLGSAKAVGFGAIGIESSIGQPLKARIPLLGSDTAELTSTCIKTRLQTADGAALGSVAVALSRSPRGNAVLVSTLQAIDEPAILLDVTVSCGAAVHREFSILLDPVGSSPTVPDDGQFATPGVVSATPLRERRHALRSESRSGSQDLFAADLAAQPATPTASQVDTSPKTAFRSPRSAASTKPILLRKSVLKLSNEGFTDAELASMGHLKMSESLSDTVQPVGAEQRDDLLAARIRFAQVLHGDDPNRITSAEIVADVRQITGLRSKLAIANQQHAVDQATIVSMSKTMAPMKWLALLGILLLASLLLAAWLAWRLRSTKQQSISPWDLALASPAKETSRASSTTVVVPLVEPLPRKTVGTDFGHNPTTVRQQDFAAPNSTARSSSQKAEPKPPPTPVLPIGIPAVAAGAILSAESIADQHDALQSLPSKLEHLKVEEISDVMQEAEFWMSLNDPQRAIEILEPYAKIDLPDSPMPWLYLLDLYRGTGQRLKYDALHDKASRVFNARIPLWDEDGDLSDGRTLEDFPHVVEKICALWETNEIFDYLEGLIFDKREGIREGFDLFVYQEIMLLLTMVRSYGRDPSPLPFGGSDKLQLVIDS